ncbi:hypothetical protein GOBAR_AA35487 [Gossypium barbadense]|uniref:Uncharacterized protein n=1 Tax=Gossypium barbadense TaxID=3634 RepID=A0A2P5W2B6_GOSBA|nr:hypothetical protein GOBAR_AA35487 [Gossypium barbadense]
MRNIDCPPAGEERTDEEEVPVGGTKPAICEPRSASELGRKMAESLWAVAGRGSWVRSTSDGGDLGGEVPAVVGDPPVRGGRIY